MNEITKKSALFCATICGKEASLRPGYEAAVSTRALAFSRISDRDFHSNQKLGLRQFGFSAGDLCAQHKTKPNLIITKNTNSVRF